MLAALQKRRCPGGGDQGDREAWGTVAGRRRRSPLATLGGVALGTPSCLKAFRCLRSNEACETANTQWTNEVWAHELRTRGGRLLAGGARATGSRAGRHSVGQVATSDTRAATGALSVRSPAWA